MTSGLADSPETPTTSVRERVVVDAVGRAAHVAHEAQALKTLAADAIEDGIHAARRAVVRGVHDVEDLRDVAAHRVKRAPLASVALAAGAGLLVGVVLGRWGMCVGAQPGVEHGPMT